MKLLELDRIIFHFFNGSQSQFMDGLVMALTSGLTWIPLYIVLFYLVLKNNETMAQIMLVVGCTALCVLSINCIDDGIVKPLISRCRPSNDPMLKYSIDVVNSYRGDGFSFFSAHAANTMGIAIFFGLLIRSRLLSSVMVLWSLMNGWTRVYLGVHYPSDVLAGWAFGALVGFMFYLLYHKMYYKISPKLNYISSQYTKTGYDYSDIDVVMTVLAFTLVYALFRGIIPNY